MPVSLPWYERLLERPYRAGLQASVEALYAPSPCGRPDRQAAELDTRAPAWIEGLPPSQRPLLKLLFAGIELGAPVLVPCVSRFSRLPAERRLAVVIGWMDSDWTVLRLLGEAMTAALQMVYLSHPTVVRFVGEYRPFANPGDAFDIDVLDRDQLEAVHGPSPR